MHVLLAFQDQLDYLRIATEEAVAPPKLLARYRKLLDRCLSTWVGYATFPIFQQPLLFV